MAEVLSIVQAKPLAVEVLATSSTTSGNSTPFSPELPKTRAKFSMCRSSTGAFEKWADEVDDQSYTFDNLLPFFKKSVHFNPPKSLAIPSNVSLPHQIEDFSLTGGPLQVSFARHLNTISSWLGNAFEELGFARLPSFSDGRLFGWSYFTYTVDPASQTRSSSETSFLREALRETTNLNFYKSTLVKKIIFENCQTASGVLVNTAGVEYTIAANREVILSAGAVSNMSSWSSIRTPAH